MGFLKRYRWGMLASIPLVPLAMWAQQQWPWFPFDGLILLGCVVLLFVGQQQLRTSIKVHDTCIGILRDRGDAHERVIQTHATQLDVLEKRARAVHNGGRFRG